MPEFAFDVVLNAVIRITADTEQKARLLLDELTDEQWIDHYLIQRPDASAWLTAGSVDLSNNTAELFEETSDAEIKAQTKTEPVRFCVNVRAKINGDADFLESFEINEPWSVYDYTVTDSDENNAVLRADTTVYVTALTKAEAAETAKATYPALGISGPMAPCDVLIWVDEDIDVTAVD